MNSRFNNVIGTKQISKTIRAIKVGDVSSCDGGIIQISSALNSCVGITIEDWYFGSEGLREAAELFITMADIIDENRESD